MQSRYKADGKTLKGKPAPGMKRVRNLMSGKEIEIEIDTPGYLDPSRESYWSM